MKRLIIFFALAWCISACDDGRVFEKNEDFDERFWAVTNTPEFEFEITDTSINYNLYCNLRNSLSYPFKDFYLNYALTDSTGTQLQQKEIETFLFEDSGKPQGNSGLGDIYDQRIPLLQNFHFANPGVYKVRFEQKTRTDSLQGVLAVGLRVEKSALSK